MHRLVIGCGYLGRRVAQRWASAGDWVAAVTRSPARAAEWAGWGWHPQIADVNDPQTLADRLRDCPPLTTVCWAVGWDRSSSASLRDVYVRGLENTLQALAPHASSLRKLIYISSTGVYGQNDGSWVDEDSLCQPTREGGRVCLEAEQLLSASPFGRRSIILRCAGLYGPGRIPHLAALREGQPLAVPTAGHLNLIHVDDAARLVVAVDQQVTPPELLVACAGHPVTRQEYFAALARLLGAPVPRFVPPASDSAAVARSGGDKRVRSCRLDQRLTFRWLYPDHETGLAAILRAAETESGPIDEQPPAAAG